MGTDHQFKKKLNIYVWEKEKKLQNLTVGRNKTMYIMYLFRYKNRPVGR